VYNKYFQNVYLSAAVTDSQPVLVAVYVSDIVLSDFKMQRMVTLTLTHPLGNQIQFANQFTNSYKFVKQTR